jgi:hypothetical protein
MSRRIAGGGFNFGIGGRQHQHQHVERTAPEFVQQCHGLSLALFDPQVVIALLPSEKDFRRHIGRNRRGDAELQSPVSSRPRWSASRAGRAWRQARPPRRQCMDGAAGSNRRIKRLAQREDAQRLPPAGTKVNSGRGLSALFDYLAVSPARRFGQCSFIRGSVRPLMVSASKSSTTFGVPCSARRCILCSER